MEAWDLGPIQLLNAQETAMHEQLVTAGLDMGVLGSKFTQDKLNRETISILQRIIQHKLLVHKKTQLEISWQCVLKKNYRNA